MNNYSFITETHHKKVSISISIRCSSWLCIFCLCLEYIYISPYVFLFLVVDKLAKPLYNELLYRKFVSDVKCIKVGDKSLT